jgi:hypothetical protein
MGCHDQLFRVEKIPLPIQIEKASSLDKIELPKITLTSVGELSSLSSVKKPSVSKRKKKAIAPQIRAKELVRFLPPADKNLQVERVVWEESEQDLSGPTWHEPTHGEVAAIDSSSPVEHFGFHNSASALVVTNWEASLESKLEQAFTKAREATPKQDIDEEVKVAELFSPEIIESTAPEIKTTIEDKVSEVQSSTTKSPEVVSVVAQNDEMVMIDYSEPSAASEVVELKQEEVQPTAPRDSSLSANVMEAIEREMQQAKKVSIHNPTPSSTRQPKQAPEYSNPKSLDYSVLKIASAHVIIGAGVKGAARELEFVPDYSTSERFVSDGEGQIELAALKGRDHGVISGTLIGRDLMKTRIEINLDGKNNFIHAPVFDDRSYISFLEQKGLTGEGSHLLIELDEQVEDVDLDAGYEKKVYLDRDFKEVGREGDFSIVLFANSVPGNTTIRLLTTQGEIQKVVTTRRDEITFDYTDIEFGKKISVSFLEKNLLARRAKDLEISSDQASSYGSKARVTQSGPSALEFFYSSRAEGERNYFELRHLNAAVYASTQSGVIELPSTGLISHVLEGIGLNDLTDRCLVQVNVPSDLLDAEIAVDSGEGAINFDAYFLDSDGEISRSPNELTQKIFILGDQFGGVNAKLTLQSGQSHYLKSFCSIGTYLVEHL